MDFHRGILPYKQEDNMSLFRKKKWDIERSEQNKGLIRQLFSQAMPDGDTWKIVYGYGCGRHSWLSSFHNTGRCSSASIRRSLFF